MYLYFAAKVRKSIHIMAYQCIKKQKEGEKEFIIYKKRSLIYTKKGVLIYTKKEADSHLPLFGNLTNILFSNRITTF